MADVTTKLRTGSPVVGAWVSLADPAVAELTARSGVDFVVVDLEHTPNSLETVANQIRGVDAAESGTAPLVRVRGLDQLQIKRVLDLGVAGVVIPMVDTVDEAERAVEVTRYPPNGVRGIAATRGTDYGRAVADIVEDPSESPLVIAQVESERGLSNVEAIAAVDGVDALFVGPLDLTGALGVFGQWDSTTFEDAVERIVAAGAEAGTAVGTFGSGHEDIEAMMTMGFDFVIAGMDTAHLIEGTQRAHDAARDVLGE